ncbi:MAG: alpha/beta fold hydrolase [Actinophytocola sp.]|uniref:alpha/beta fold hydrolase n=1 Tax=Actinophytocola sp. TaxID=1872138 RepID=UPI001324F1ED|nr:alpha/beta hydrolase [Actinophytocola sp.]MPZ86025.1 alpha/beta fold hydrolase [Actinophytocola sp.]
MNTLISTDGTTIAYDRAGSGPVIVLVAGAFNDRATLAPLAAELAGDFTVVTYDRRARGDSGNTKPWSIDREAEDLDALIAEVGGSTFVFGFSSGGILGMHAALRGSAIPRLVCYEPPFPVEGHGNAPDLPARLAALVDAGRPGDAVELFQLEAIGLPPEVVAQIRKAPIFPALEAMAQSLVYDSTITTGSTPPATLSTPTLTIYGAQTWESLARAAIVAAEVLPKGRHQEVPGGKNHTIEPAVTAPVVADFFREG